MEVTKRTGRIRKQCMPGSLSSSPAREPGNKAKVEKCEGTEAQGVPRGREGCKC